jgi:signal transduction histidine kinase
MGRAVSTLLKLARLEMGAETFDHEGVDLGQLVAEVLQSLPAVERELRVDDRTASDYLAEGDREALRIVVSNLLSNALHYSPPREGVACLIESSAAGWRVVVENASTELRPEDFQALSEPFWRKDRARADRNHSGLGLALSRALAEKTGLRLVFELEDGTFRAILSGGVTLERREPSTVA